MELARQIEAMVLDPPSRITQKSFDELKEKVGKLGFEALTRRMEEARRLALAYAKYGVVTQAQINNFNEELRAKTQKSLDYGRGYSFQRLLFTPIKDYTLMPPPEALSRLEDAIADGLFDGYVVAAIHDVKELPDPIIFGKINGCTDYFFIAQWDDDVKIEDIIHE